MGLSSLLLGENMTCRAHDVIGRLLSGGARIGLLSCRLRKKNPMLFKEDEFPLSDLLRF